ncbi:MAG: enoyl-CoA hydratase-related protein, partial [Solirubrobacterales bacterium]
ALGLVQRLAAAGEADLSAAKLAGEIAAMPAEALAAIKRCVFVAGERTTAEGMAFEAGEILGLFDSEAAREGLAAFLEKRDPNFS